MSNKIAAKDGLGIRDPETFFSRISRTPNNIKNMSTETLPSGPTTPQPQATDHVEEEKTQTLLILSHCEKSRKMARGRLLSKIADKLRRGATALRRNGEAVYVAKYYGDDLKGDR